MVCWVFGGSGLQWWHILPDWSSVFADRVVKSLMIACWLIWSIIIRRLCKNLITWVCRWVYLTSSATKKPFVTNSWICAKLLNHWLDDWLDNFFWSRLNNISWLHSGYLRLLTERKNKLGIARWHLILNNRLAWRLNLSYKGIFFLSNYSTDDLGRWGISLCLNNFLRDKILYYPFRTNSLWRL